MKNSTLFILICLIAYNVFSTIYSIKANSQIVRLMEVNTELIESAEFYKSEFNEQRELNKQQSIDHFLWKKIAWDVGYITGQNRAIDSLTSNRHEQIGERNQSKYFD